MSKDWNVKMNSINEDLLKSLSQDIKKINEINDEINLHLSNFERSSWLLSCRSEEEMFKKATKDCYLSTLEVVIDRIYLFLNSLLNFIETEYYKEKQDSGFSSKYIVRPKNLTLGTTVKILWQKINDCKNAMEPSDKSSSESECCRNYIHETVQTETSAFDCCYSCSNVTVFIKHLREIFEKHVVDSAVVKEKEEIRQNLYCMTQHSCVSKLLEQMERDVKNLVEKKTFLEQQNKKLQLENEDFEFKCTCLKRDLQKLEESRRELENDVQKDKEQYENLMQRCNELYHKKNELEQHTKDKDETLESMKNLVSQLQESLMTLDKSKSDLKEELTEVLSTNKILHAEKDMWKGRFMEENSENLKLKGNIASTQEKVSEVKSYMSKIDGNYKELNTLIKRSTSEYDTTVKRYGEVLKKLKDVVSSRLLSKIDSTTVSDSEITKTCDAAIEIEGDPLADMSKQVKANEELIERLRNKNSHLVKIIKNLQTKRTRCQ